MIQESTTMHIPGEVEKAARDAMHDLLTSEYEADGDVHGRCRRLMNWLVGKGSGNSREIPEPELEVRFATVVWESLTKAIQEHDLKLPEEHKINIALLERRIKMSSPMSRLGQARAAVP